MVKGASYFICQKCGSEHSKWTGRCTSCGEWNSLQETVSAVSKKRGFAKLRAGRQAVKPVQLGQVTGQAEARVLSGMGEFDRVLGGGIVPGEVILVAGEPGIGKSTLLTQLALSLVDLRLKTKKQLTVLYVCGEESPAQIRMRIERIQDKENKSQGVRSREEHLLFLPETDVDEVKAQILQLSGGQAGKTRKLDLVIVDSIQTMATADLGSGAGSISQISECAVRLIETAKRSSIPMVLVGHVTKEGSIAGPKVLEHMVDAVLELTGDKQHEFRLLRANKNRFGATDEVGIFAMEDKGLVEVANPSDRFLADRQKGVAGSVTVCVMEGTRPVLVEIQALVVASGLAIPRRVASGVDQRRVQILTAVLTKVCALRLSDKDIYVNVAGGITVKEPASDFGIAMAIASSVKNKAFPNNAVVVGEVGLLGEIRRVSRLKQRLAEARAQGFTKVLTAENYSSLKKAMLML